MEFTLLPFRKAAPFAAITGTMERQPRRLQISFAVPDHDHLVWPEPLDQPERRTGLWSSTCFECFIQAKDATQYFECNFTPSGLWQVFRFDSYRHPPLTESDLILVKDIKTDSTGIHSTLEFQDPHFVTQQWQISPTCILADNTGLHYYANEHPFDQPDFHLASLRRFLLT